MAIMLSKNCQKLPKMAILLTSKLPKMANEHTGYYLYAEYICIYTPHSIIIQHLIGYHAYYSVHFLKLKFDWYMQNI